MFERQVFSTYSLTMQKGMQQRAGVQSPLTPGVHGMASFTTKPSAHANEFHWLWQVEGWPKQTPPRHAGERMLGAGAGHACPSPTESQ